MPIGKYGSPRPHKWAYKKKKAGRKVPFVRCFPLFFSLSTNSRYDGMINL